MDFSQKYLDSLRFPNYPTLHFRIKARNLITKFRNFQRRWFPTRPAKCDWSGKNLITPVFEEGAKHYREHGWVFLENILDSKFHEELTKNWPKVRYLEPPWDLKKSYNRGMQWIKKTKENPDFHNLHPHVAAFLDFLKTKEFGERVTNFAGDRIERSCHAFLVTSSVTGTNVAPHRDSSASTEEGKSFVNFVFFIKGTGGSNSGGLAILGDNTFDKVIFESKNLVNSVLVYNVYDPFYHGFPPIAFGKDRQAIITEFCDPGVY